MGVSDDIFVHGLDDKTQVAEFVMEYWTSEGFVEKDASYNRLVLSRNGYGDWKAKFRMWWRGAIENPAAAPWQVVVLLRQEPAGIRLLVDLDAYLPCGVRQDSQGIITGGRVIAWLGGFVVFLREWTKSSVATTLLAEAEESWKNDAHADDRFG